MRLAWFSPMPPVRSGIAACSAELVAALGSEYHIDVYVDEPVAKIAPGTRSAHEFVWRQRQAPYDLTIYQLGNSSHHDYLWPYLFRYPGLAVLHDAHLHHARAAALLRTRRAGDYRTEFAANHPGASVDLAELAVAGFDSPLYYAWPMTRLMILASRLTVVHAQEIAADLRAEIPSARVDAIRLAHGTPVSDARAGDARRRVCAAYGLSADVTIFGVFGGLTPEKRLPQILDAFGALLPYAPSSHLLLCGAAARHYDVAADVRARGLESRVTLTGYLEADEELTECIAACDVALNLRWPTAREMSGPWLRSLAAGKPTVIVDLAHLVDVPSLDPRTWRVNHPVVRGPLSVARGPLSVARGSDSGRTTDNGPRTTDSGPRTADNGPRTADPVTIAIDIMDEDHSLRLALRRLAGDADLRRSLGAAARRYWEREHSPDRMLTDYRRAIALAAAVPAPRVSLPPHLVTSGDRLLNELLAGMTWRGGELFASTLDPARDDWGRL